MGKEEQVKQAKEAEAQLKKLIVEDQERLGLDDTFQFGCHPGVSCYNSCCGDVNIFLSPYDVLRMKKRLGMTSMEFLKEYTLLPIQKDITTPVVVLRMGDDEARSCPFLKESGCGIYTDRPWPCRMYPIGLATSKDTPDGWQGERFYFLLREETCKGFDEAKEWTVREWLEDQGVDEYDVWGEAYKELTLNRYFEEGNTLTPEKMEMFYTASYDLDKFREFVFESTLLDRFEIDEDFVDEMKTSDEALLRFGFLWLQFSLFGEQTMKVRAEVAEAYQGKLDKRELRKSEPAGSSEKEAQ
ncbi:YkgJ family cysteine cluster protein [Candidatus Zixiibacteriota bacterium]